VKCSLSLPDLDQNWEISTNLNKLPPIILGERGCSVSIVTVYGLGDRGSIPDRGRGFSP
jgi:hypothetical protein